MISGSGSSDLLVHATKEPDFPREQLIQHAHRLGCHHLVTSANGAKLASAGFDGQVKLWTADDDGQWHVEREIVGETTSGIQNHLRSRADGPVEMAWKVGEFGR